MALKDAFKIMYRKIKKRIIESLLGITKPAEGINKPYLGNFVMSSSMSEVKTSIIARTSVKAVDTFYTQEFVQGLVIFLIAII